MRENQPANPTQHSLIKPPKESTKRRITVASRIRNGDHFRNENLFMTLTWRRTQYKTKVPHRKTEGISRSRRMEVGRS